MTEPENYADALEFLPVLVLCRDGKYRTFVTTDADRVLKYEGRKYTYRLMSEPEGRGFVTMMLCQGGPWRYVLAPERMQPVKIEAKTWAGRWNWEIIG